MPAREAERIKIMIKLKSLQQIFTRLSKREQFILYSALFFISIIVSTSIGEYSDFVGSTPFFSESISISIHDGKILTRVLEIFNPLDRR